MILVKISFRSFALVSTHAFSILHFTDIWDTGLQESQGDTNWRIEKGSHYGKNLDLERIEISSNIKHSLF